MSKKLGNIEKKNIYDVPDGYFDQLPAVIQSKAVTKTKIEYRLWTAPATKWALASAFVLVIGYFALFNNEDHSRTPEALLAEVETQQLIDYLTLAEITADETIEDLDYNEIDFVFDSSPTDLFDDPPLEDLEYFLEGDIEVNEL